MLVKHAYNESLHLHETGFKTWVSNVWEIANKYQINIETKTSSFQHIVKNQINEHYMENICSGYCYEPNFADL